MRGRRVRCGFRSGRARDAGLRCRREVFEEEELWMSFVVDFVGQLYRAWAGISSMDRLGLDLTFKRFVFGESKGVQGAVLACRFSKAGVGQMAVRHLQP